MCTGAIDDDTLIVPLIALSSVQLIESSPQRTVTCLRPAQRVLISVTIQAQYTPGRGPSFHYKLYKSPFCTVFSSEILGWLPRCIARVCYLFNLLSQVHILEGQDDQRSLLISVFPS